MERPYALALSIVSELLALLCFGLGRRWGEVVPAWVPGLRGRRIPPFAVIVPAALGVLAFLVLLADWLRSAFHLGGRRFRSPTAGTSWP